MEKRYNPADVESRIYRMWEGGGYFTPKFPASSLEPRASSFCIIMPPPNANDPLHMGHALFVALEDLMIRYHRMKGDVTLWLPGADHAGIETQYVFEKKLSSEGKSRFDFTREEFYQMVWDYVQKNIGTMKEQLKSLGASCDWTRFKYTLDPDIIKIVYETFYQLLQDGLAYRDERIINFCTQCGTAFSDLEVKYQERNDPLYYIQYGPIKKSKVKSQKSKVPLKSQNFLKIATVRPETMFGDTALAVNPQDKRYKKLIGEKIVHPLTSEKIPIIADEAVDPKFGTGVIKVTPAHDSVDFEIGKRHNLEVKRVIGFDGKLTALTDHYQGRTLVKARKKVAEDLQKRGLLVKVEPTYKHIVGTCYRCGTVIEPMILPQWFISVKGIVPQRDNPWKGLSLKESGIQAVKTGKIKIIPKKYEKQYLHWMENLRDWNISRQIWWGIRIPVWYCADCNKIKKYGSITWIPKEAKSLTSTATGDKRRGTPKKGPLVGVFGGKRLAGPVAACPDCGSQNLIQDPDTFDTWFSSSQWPFATLQALDGQKSNFQLPTSNFQTFYPTSVMETAYDILYFWVARMIMMGIYRTGQFPFKTVYLHGLLRDVHRVKMSKSKGNVINPLEMTEKYSADALRMALIIGSSPGNDVILWEKKIEGYRNFANKVWNIGRFIKMLEQRFNLLAKRVEGKHLPDPAEGGKGRLNLIGEKKVQPLNKEDKIILKDLNRLIKNTTRNLENFRFSQAAEELYHFIWHRLADEYLEYAKTKLPTSNFQLPTSATKGGETESTLAILNHVYLTTLRLLHPFMPFITEELWGIFNQKKPLIISRWPNIPKLQG